MPRRHRYSGDVIPECWKQPLKRIATEIRTDFRDWTWTKGGCFAFAEAFQQAFGGDLWGVCSYDTDANDWPVEHALVKYKNNFYDFDGIFDPVNNLMVQSLKKTKQVEIKPKSDENVAWFFDDFLNDDQMMLLNQVMQDCAKRSR